MSTIEITLRPMKSTPSAARKSTTLMMYLVGVVQRVEPLARGIACGC